MSLRHESTMVAMELQQMVQVKLNVCTGSHQYDHVRAIFYILRKFSVGGEPDVDRTMDQPDFYSPRWKLSGQH